MRTRFLKVSLLCVLFATGVFVTGCSDDNKYADVDGEAPVAVLKADHIQSGAGHDFEKRVYPARRRAGAGGLQFRGRR